MMKSNGNNLDEYINALLKKAEEAYLMALEVINNGNGKVKKYSDELLEFAIAYYGQEYGK
ncbi:MAG: hypothetical protein FWE33_05225 [Defluviitaleaceae bacterium]|nr:hypothetical protein [Defluviitaleaceae bacterium]